MDSPTAQYVKLSWTPPSDHLHWIDKLGRQGPELFEEPDVDYVDPS